MLDILFKKANGYTVSENTKEYVYDEDGGARLLKQRIQEKHIPPDLSAIKAYMEAQQKQLFEMTESQLNREKQRLLRLLQKNNQIGEKYGHKNKKPTHKGSKGRF